MILILVIVPAFIHIDFILKEKHFLPFLGAGQDVGRSCILLQMGGKNIMLDCGMHMGYNDEVSKSPSHFLIPIINILVFSLLLLLEEISRLLIHC